MSEIVERAAQAVRDVNSDTEGLTYAELTTNMARAAIVEADPILRNALEPFARMGARAWPGYPDDFVVCSFRDDQITIGDLRGAMAALAGRPQRITP